MNFVFFLGAIGFGVVIQHPAYVLSGLLCGGTYYLLLNGRKGWKLIFGLVPLFLLTTVINPLLNSYGATVLFFLFGRPYTLEALLYGAVIAGVFVGMLIWFGCYNAVLTSDKFTCLFGSLIPALSLLLVMVLRMIPNLIRKAQQLLGARMSIGKGRSERTSNKEKVIDGMMILSALADWALEGSVVTGDSMRSRGYGTGKHTSFMIYRMTGLDLVLLAMQLFLAAVVLAAAATGGTEATYTPNLQIAPLSGGHLAGYAAYWAYLLIPTALHIKEALTWHISKSKI